MSRYFGPVFVTIAAVSSALVWRFAPEAGPKLPVHVRDGIFSAFQALRSGVKSVQASAERISANWKSQYAGAGAAPGGSEAGQPLPMDGSEEPAASASTAPGSAPDEPAAVARTDQNPTGSPYLEPAARALREFSAQSDDFDRRRKKMSLFEQRAGMKKLGALRERVEFYNRKHREWKLSHPAETGSGR